MQLPRLMAQVLPAALAFSTPALSGEREKAADRRAQAVQAVQAITSGEHAGPAVERIRYLGEELFAAEQLMGYAGASDPRIRRAVAESLAVLARPEAEPALERLASDDDGATRMAAVQGLRAVHSRAAGAVLPLLRDKTLGVRREAALTLGAMGRPALGKPLLRAAQVEEEPEVRAALIAAVGQSGASEERPALERFLRSSSESTRRAAAQGLCWLGARSGYEFIRGLLASADASARADTLLLLEGIPARRTGPLLLPLLKDPAPRVAAHAARLLYQGGDRKMAAWLVIAAHNARSEDRLIYENEIDSLNLSPEDRAAILEKAGLK